MDKEFLALSIAFILLGLTGIVLFNGPLTPSGDSCYCLIPTPEPGAAQGTSSIILALGVMFFPMGLMKGGLPAFRRVAPGPSAVKVPGVTVVSPIQIASGSYFALGIVVLLVGINVLVPGYLVLHNFYYELSGILMIAAGALAFYWGLRKPKAA